MEETERGRERGREDGEEREREREREYWLNNEDKCVDSLVVSSIYSIFNWCHVLVFHTCSTSDVPDVC